MSIDDIIPGEEEEKNVNPHRPIALSIAQSIQQAPGRPGRGTRRAGSEGGVPYT